MGLFDAFDEPEVREGYLRTALHYMGNKYESLDNIIPQLPRTNTFVDVFGGSGQVTLAVKPYKLQVYNDRHSGLTAFFRCLQDSDKLNELAERIKLFPHSREFFAWCKETWDKNEDDVIRAAKTYYMFQSSFAGRGKYFGRVTKGVGSIWRKIHESIPEFAEMHERLISLQIENLDWRMIFKDYDSYETVWYLDPPYYGSNVYQFSMSKDEHRELCEAIFSLKGYVALSGFDNEVYSSFNWDREFKWAVNSRVKTVAFSEGSTMEGFEGTVDRGQVRYEHLWIKDFAA